MDILESLQEELKKPPIIKTFNLTNYRKVQSLKTGKGYRIGIIGECPKNFSGFTKGDLVLFKPYTIKDGLYRLSSKEIEKSIQHCTICVPSDRYFEGKSNISTIRTAVYFPLKYIEYEIS